MVRAKQSRLAKRRRPRGTGSIFFSTARKLWVGRIPVGKTASGRTRYVERTAATQGELLKRLATAGPPGPTTTLGQWCDRWLAGLSVRPVTARNYASVVNEHIKPALGHITLSALTTYQIEVAVRDWSRVGRPGTVATWLGRLRGCLSAAVRAGILEKNPATHARRPPAERRKLTPFTPAELAAIITEASRQPHTAAIALMAAVGCRLGEAVGLDVPDFDGARVSISKTIDPKTKQAGPPKTSRGRRVVRVPAAALPALVAAAGSRKTGPLFRTATGKRTGHGILTTVWRRLLARLGIAYRRLHALRHSVATALISAGVPVGDVAAFLGDSVQTVVATYLHASGVDPADAMERVLGKG